MTSKFFHQRRCLRQKLLQMLANAGIALQLFSMPVIPNDRKIRRFSNRIASRRKPIFPGQIRRKLRKRRNMRLSKRVDIFERTGVWEDYFEKLLGLISKKIRSRTYTRYRAVTLSLRARLVMVLHWLREYPTYKTLAAIYKVHPSYISREINFLLPIIYTTIRDHLSVIGEPEQWEHSSIQGFEDCVGAIDCTSHFRIRVHPRQAHYYRSDKHGHFLTAQVICQLSGRIVSVHLGLGHNNDAGMLNLTDTKRWLVEQDIKLIGDGGYSFGMLCTPDESKGEAYQEALPRLRSVVENVNAQVMNWKVCSSKFKQSVELQEMAVMTVWHLAAYSIDMIPLRSLEQF